MEAKWQLPMYISSLLSSQKLDTGLTNASVLYVVHVLLATVNHTYLKIRVLCEPDTLVLVVCDIIVRIILCVKECMI